LDRRAGGWYRVDDDYAAVAVAGGDPV
jgi:hypothetical protein